MQLQLAKFVCHYILQLLAQLYKVKSNELYNVLFKLTALIADDTSIIDIVLLHATDCESPILNQIGQRLNHD